MEKERSVIVMIGDYPRETALSDVPKVKEMARKMTEYFLSKGFPKEQVERLYTIRVIEETDQE